MASDDAIKTEAEFHTGPRPRPVMLLVIDGWGIAPAGDNNAFSLVETPYISELLSQYPATVLHGHPGNNSDNYRILGAFGNQDDLLSISRLVSDLGLRQLKVAESDRLPLITDFFNGKEGRLSGEDVIAVPSEIRDDYKELPEMSTNEVVKKIIQAIKSDDYDFIVSSWPNLELVGRSGDIKASIEAIELLDSWIKKVSRAILEKNGVLVIASTYGKVEYMINMQLELANKDITNNPVPLIIVGGEFTGRTIGLKEAPLSDLSLLEPQGSIDNILPTLLSIMHINPGREIEAENLISWHDN